jgi:hypothetical protein
MVDSKSEKRGPGVVAQTYNPSQSGCGDWEDCGSRTAWTKSLQDPISTNGWVQFYSPVIPAMQGSTNRRLACTQSRLVWA